MSQSNDFVQSASTTTVYDLNDYNLRDIFDHLDDKDLCSVADVCFAFKRNAEAEFSARYRFDCYFFNDEQDENYDWKTYQIDLLHLSSLLRNFGSLITAFDISLTDAVNNHSQEVLEMIIKNCGESLVKLSLLNVRFTADMIRKMIPMLARLEEFHVKMCRWVSMASMFEMFSHCAELETLYLDAFQNFDDKHFDFPIRYTIPKLHTLDLEGCDVMRAKSLLKFIKLNPQLEKLAMIGCKKITSRFIPPMVQYIPNIEELLYMHNIFTNDFFENVKHLKHLRALKSLQIDFDSMSISSFINELAAGEVPLESLKIWNFKADKELVNGISKLKKLRQLELVGRSDFNESELEEIVMNLPELRHLYTHIKPTTDLANIVRFAPKLRYLRFDTEFDYTLDVTLYSEMLDAVSKRKNRCPMVLSMFTRGQDFLLDVPEKLLKANQDLLRVLML